jgi:hypothetical protein
VNNTTKSQDFWQFWGSRKKKSVAIAINLLASVVVTLGIISSFFGFANEPAQQNNITTTTKMYHF